LPKSRYFVAGDKEGYLSLYDLSSAELASDLKAHEASIWSLALHAQAKSFSGITLASASADKRVRFWQLVADKKSKRLALAEARTVWFPEDIHCVRFTPNGEHYLVSLLDYSVRVHFCDSDREFLSLYGHKLPVLR
jgi:U3 small nucleolar RNA-associated protein 12